MSESKASLKRCAACHKAASETGSGSTTALQVCSRCKSVAYCSRECQINDWKLHKSQCTTLSLGGQLANTSISPKSVKILSNPIPDPWSRFKPFLDSISTELGSVLSLVYVPDVHEKDVAKRKIGWYHLHFSVNSDREASGKSPKDDSDTATNNSRRQFSLKFGQRFKLDSFLSWIKSEPSHLNQPAMINTYSNQFKSLLSSDASVFTPGGKYEGKSGRRLICTAEDVNKRFLGISTIILASHTMTRSGLDPSNEKFDWVGPLSSILSTIEPASSTSDKPTSNEPESTESTALLEKIAKECSKNSEWLEKSMDDFKTIEKGEKALLHAALLKRGLREEILLGGRFGKGYYYAVPVSESPTKCTCGKIHRTEEHYLEDDEDENESDEDEVDDEEEEYELDSDEDGCTPPYYNAHFGHSHDESEEGDGLHSYSHSHSHAHSHSQSHSHYTNSLRASSLSNSFSTFLIRPEFAMSDPSRKPQFSSVKTT